MSKLRVERIGGFAGFGGPNSKLRSVGEIDTEQLSSEDKKVVEELFVSTKKGKSTVARDTFRFKISRVTSKGSESIEAEEENVPDVVRRCVRDEII
jgi:hypothetical protein